MIVCMHMYEHRGHGSTSGVFPTCSLSDSLRQVLSLNLELMDLADGVGSPWDPQHWD